MRYLSIIVVVALLAAGAWLALGRRADPAEVGGSIVVAEALGAGADAGFARASAPRDFAFPADHGPHPAYKIEWWYYTGNLAAGERHFGYQLTFFRVGLAPAGAARESDWAARQIYMAHFAVTDVAGERFFAAERYSRAAMGLAGAQAAPFRVWLEDWQASSPGAAALPMRLQAAENDVAIDLHLDSAKPIVLQGEQGLSQKGSEPGNASYYYSLTRMPTSGTISIGGQTWNVAGTSWMDREWSTSVLSENVVGWDWFAVQLADDSELMLYQLRQKDGGISPLSGATLVRPDGSTRPLTASEVRLAVVDTWRAPSGTSYPARWTVSIPAEQIELAIEPYLADQELQLTVRYWEGAVRVTGTRAGQPISGDGYVELTGYGDSAAGRR